MRYILNSEGYVWEASLGAAIMCDLGNCTEYTGKIPSGYSTIDEWLIEEAPRLNAWKIVDGNLVFDRDKAAELERICNEQARLNRHVTYGEVEGMLNNLDIEVSNKNEIEGILPIRTEEGEVIYVDDSSSYPVERILVTAKETIEDFNLYISTSNMLPNEAKSGSKSGVAYVVNEDKSIELYGSLTNNFDLTINGSEGNTKPLFILKAGVTYYLNKVSDTVTFSMYSNDGTDRLLYYTGGGGVSITPEEDIPITHTELSVSCDYVITEDGLSLETENGQSLVTENSITQVNETIYLMLSVGSAAKEYEQCYYTIVPVDLNGHTAERNDVIELVDGIIILDDGGINLVDMPCTYYEKTTIYADKETYLEVDYKKSSFETVTKSGKGALNLRNTADGYGSIFNLTIKNLAGGTTYTLESSDGDERIEQYTIDLTNYEGNVDVVIEGGQPLVYQDGVCIDYLDKIYIQTYSPRTYIELLDCTNRMTCEYMVESDFSIYCTRVEKDASIKIVEDQIALEVKRASDMEGELSSRITVEANRITQEVARAKDYEEELYSLIEVEAGKISQIVRSVGDNGKVTSASIIQSINEDTSSIQISADKIDIQGKNLPTISNEDGSCKIDSQYIISGVDTIRHTADVHQFEYYGDKTNSDFRVITRNFHFLGNGEFRVKGDFYLNGELFDGTAKFG